MLPKVGLGIANTSAVDRSVYYSHLLLWAEMIQHPEIEEDLIYVQGAQPHDRARNLTINDLLEHNCNWWMSLDADVLVPSKAFNVLWETAKETGAEVVTGNYRRRGYPYTSIWYEEDGNYHRTSLATEGLHKLTVTGLGCVLINLDWLMTHLDPPYSLFESDNNGCLITDDTSLFKKIREAGGKIIGNAAVDCAHFGDHLPVTRHNEAILRQAYLATYKRD